MKKALYYILAFALGTSLFASCEKEDPIGPSLVDLYGPFRILDSLTVPSTIDFTKDSLIIFGGTWSNISDWKITITGESSGAIKTIEGKSKTIDTLIASWDGTADGIFFKKEICSIQLTFKDYSDTITAKTTITELHDYSKDGIILEPFENTPVFYFNPLGTITLITNNSIPQGRKYAEIKSNEEITLNNQPKWWLGGFPGFIDNTLNFNFNETDSIYINFFAKGLGYTGSKISITAKEDQNDDGEIDVEYGYTTEDINSDNWQKYSISYSSLINNSITKKNNPSKLKELYISFVSDGIEGPKGFAIDFIIITQGKPL